MKPDAWIQSNHLPVKAAAMCRLADHKLMSDFLPLYSAETIRKWLNEDPSEAMIALGVNVPSPPYFIDSFKEREELIVTSIYKTLITVKLEELK